MQAIYSLGTLRRFRFPDWQGTIRAESEPAGRDFSESLAFAPFGERYALKGTPYNVDSFTGKPDQLVSDEYDFPAREEHNAQGRWVSPDPMRGTGNKYVYANNNPLSNVDVYGLFAITVNGLEVGTADDILDYAAYHIESGPSQSQQTGGQTTPTSSQTPSPSSSQTTTAQSQQQAQAAGNQQQGQPAAAAVATDAAATDAASTGTASTTETISGTEAGALVSGAESTAPSLGSQIAKFGLDILEDEVVPLMILTTPTPLNSSEDADLQKIHAAEDAATKDAAPEPAAAAGGRGSRKHGNTIGNQYAELYALMDRNGRFLKWGVSQNANTRYSKGQLNGGGVIVVGNGTRDEMISLERALTEMMNGPLNLEPWAGSAK